MTQQQRRGFVPGGEDRVQWMFEGEDWTSEEQEMLIALVTIHVLATREKCGFDVTNYFQFSKNCFSQTGSEIEYLYYCQRATWGYNLMGFSAQELAKKVQQEMNRHLVPQQEKGKAK